MGDVPISYIEGIGGTRVSEDDIVAVGKHDVSFEYRFLSYEIQNGTNHSSLQILSFKVGR